MTKQQKIIQWLTEQGYPNSTGACQLFTKNDKGYLSQYETVSAYIIIKNKEIPLALYKDGEFIKIPDFQDDKPEPKDKVFQQLMRSHAFSHSYAKILTEFNDRVKALEAAVLKEGE